MRRLLRDLRGPVADGWARVWARSGTRPRIALAFAGVLAAVLLGAFLFGLWHVLFGGLVKGNWRAGGFGVALAVIAGAALALEVAVVRRVLPPAGSS